MNKNEKYVITINRELGSGGRTVGELLAKKLGVSFYDKAVIKTLEERYNLTTKEIEKFRDRKDSWWDDFKRIANIGDGLARNNYTNAEMRRKFDVLTTENVFQVETEILQEIAEKESCVIAGRCGFFMFRNHPNHLRIFIQAPLSFRVSRLINKRGMTQEEALNLIERVDIMRENYVKKFTGSSRYDTRNYDLVINAENKTEDKIVQQILNFMD
jgi:cytidylate kinase